MITRAEIYHRSIIIQVKAIRSRYVGTITKNRPKPIVFASVIFLVIICVLDCAIFFLF